MRKGLWLQVFTIASIAVVLMLPGMALAAEETLLEVKAFPLVGRTNDLEPEVLDFRYAPGEWQVCIGLPDDPHKSIVKSDGSLNHHYVRRRGNFPNFDTSVLARVDMGSAATSTIEQRLWSAKVPIVITEQSWGPLLLHQECWADIPDGESVEQWSKKRQDYLWLTLQNTGDQAQTARLVVRVRSRTKMGQTASQALVETAGDRRTLCYTSPQCDAMMEASVRPGYEQNLIYERQLPPAGEFRALLTFYRGDDADSETPESQARKMRDKAIAYWQNADLPYGRILVADENVQHLLDSCIRNIWQARELRDGVPAFQVGPTVYRGTWAADGPFILEAVTYLGRADEARKGLELQIIEDEGPQGIEFSKKAGLRLWMVWRHAQLTGDRRWLERMWPKVEQEVNRIIEYREMTRSDPNQANYGLMPAGFGDGGLAGKHREYTNVYWTLAGLKAAIQAADRIEKPSGAAWKAEYDDYWKQFDKARHRDKLVDTAGNTYVPVTMKGEKEQLPQRGAWAFLHSIYPGRIFPADDELMLGTLAMLDATEREGLIFGTGWISDGIWNYAGSFYGHAHLWLHHSRKAAATFYAFGNHACPLLCWREEQRPLGEKEYYVGDMPHNWASAEFIRFVRHMMIMEREDELHLLEAMPRAWAEPSGQTRLTGIPTSFGNMSLAVSIADDGSTAKVTLSPPTREPLRKIVLHTKNFARTVGAITVDDKAYLQDGISVSSHEPTTVHIEFKQ
jgi:hypothetical protein